MCGDCYCSGSGAGRRVSRADWERPKWGKRGCNRMEMRWTPWLMRTNNKSCQRVPGSLYTWGIRRSSQVSGLLLSGCFSSLCWRIGALSWREQRSSSLTFTSQTVTSEDGKARFHTAAPSVAQQCSVTQRLNTFSGGSLFIYLNLVGNSLKLCMTGSSGLIQQDG